MDGLAFSDGFARAVTSFPSLGTAGLPVRSARVHSGGSRFKFGILDLKDGDGIEAGPKRRSFLRQDDNEKAETAASRRGGLPTLS